MALEFRANPSYSFTKIYPKFIINFETDKTDKELDGLIVDGLEINYDVSTKIKCKLRYVENKLFGEKIK